MRYHPDRNPEPRAEEAFILVNEAYEYLKDDGRREYLSSVLTGRHHAPRYRKENGGMDDWERAEREMARQRARAHAQARAEEFQRSPIYRAAMTLDKVYDYLFIGMGAAMATLPILGWFLLPEEMKEEYDAKQLIFPFLIGCAFIYGIWYFLFKLGRSEE